MHDSDQVCCTKLQLLTLHIVFLCVVMDNILFILTLPQGFKMGVAHSE